MTNSANFFANDAFSFFFNGHNNVFKGQNKNKHFNSLTNKISEEE